MREKRDRHVKRDQDEKRQRDRHVKRDEDEKKEKKKKEKDAHL